MAEELLLNVQVAQNSQELSAMACLTSREQETTYSKLLIPLITSRSRDDLRETVESKSIKRKIKLICLNE